MADRLFLALGTLCLVAACGGSPESSEVTSSTVEEELAALDDVDTCELVTREQVSAALGMDVGEGSEWGLSGCEWRGDRGPIVVLQVFAGSMLADGTCEAQRTLMTGREEDVSGLGESARWSSGGDLVVCSSRGVVRVDIDNSRNAPTDDRDVLVQIARHAIDGLGL